MRKFLRHNLGPPLYYRFLYVQVEISPERDHPLYLVCSSFNSFSSHNDNSDNKNYNHCFLSLYFQNDRIHYKSTVNDIRESFLFTLAQVLPFDMFLVLNNDLNLLSILRLSVFLLHK